jgi:NAD(P)-dependent dehydrogenase (short-subunit alcohol dehydrogenase family)
MMRSAVFGATGGIGAAVVEALAARHPDGVIYAGARGKIPNLPQGARPFVFDLLDESSIKAAAEEIGRDGPLDLIFIATGILLNGTEIAPEKSWAKLDAGMMAQVFALNTIGPALIAKHFLPLLPREGRCVFAALSARVGSIADNRLGGWHSYRASKAALNMIVRNLAIEMKPRNSEAIAVTLHPGTVDSALSKPFQRGVPAEKLFTTAFSAHALLGVIDELQPDDSGKLFAWDGAEIPF